MRSAAKILIGATGALAVLLGAPAGATPRPNPDSIASPANNWMMLSLLGPAQSIALGGATTDARPGNQIMPATPAATSYRIPPALAAVLASWALIALRLATLNHHKAPNSPA